MIVVSDTVCLGVYLPLLWEPTFCFRTPLALGYTRGHFSALVPMEVDHYAHLGARANLDNNEDAPTVYLPLMDNEGKILPIHFLQASEVIWLQFIISGSWRIYCAVNEQLNVYWNVSLVTVVIAWIGTSWLAAWFIATQSDAKESVVDGNPLEELSVSQKPVDVIWP